MAATVVGALVAGALATSCLTRPPTDWRPFDMLTDPIPPAPRTLAGVPVSDDDYALFLRWGETWFRDGAFGNEKAVSDVLGIMGGTVQVPCAAPAAPDCTEDVAVLPLYAAAVDALDGVQGNLFQGNGGPTGPGHTSDLVITFPPGATLFGSIPVPEQLHTGLDIEAGQLWPIGLVPVPTQPGEFTDHLPDLTTLGYPDAPTQPARLRLTCAVCHYSLDVDRDGVADLASARAEHPTPGSPFLPHHAWGVGNQDISFGWVIALSENPLFGSIVISGPTGAPGADASVTFGQWVVDNYQQDLEGVLREVSIGMLTQPRGYSDVSPDGILGSIQFPTLYTRNAWPANTDGAQTNPSDRNNTVWTGALDFTSLVGLCGDRGGGKLPWEEDRIFNHLDAQTFARMVTQFSPKVRADPSRQQEMIDDILGTSDGVPGMMDPDGVVVMKAPTIPDEILNSSHNVEAGRIRTNEDFGGDAKYRGFGMAVLGMRVATDPAWRDEIAPYADKYGIFIDDFMSEAVSLALDWLDPPPNNTALLANAAHLVDDGYRVFRTSGCEQCHRGPFGTDNRIYRLSEDERAIFGGPRAPTTAGWRVLDRGMGPAIETQPQRSQASRSLRRFASAPYDPRTGASYRKSGPLNGLLGVQQIGYKTTALRFLWGSAPYLHDGGVGVAIHPDAPPAGDDLQALLKRAGGSDLLYGMGRTLTLAEANPTAGPRADPALSLQALLLEGERARVVAHNQLAELAVPAGSRFNPVGPGPVPDFVSPASVGVHGIGHPFWIDDQPGGPRITALVAYLLALDDCPRHLPGGPDALRCDTGHDLYARGAP